MELLC